MTHDVADDALYWLETTAIIALVKWNEQVV